MRRNLDHRSVRLGGSLALETRQRAVQLRVTEGEVIRRALREYLILQAYEEFSSTQERSTHGTNKHD